MITDGATVTDGAQMFARYAFAPNRLGYCGPPGTVPPVTAGRAEIERAARQFTGAWPYLVVLSTMAGITDPLDHRVVESYWLGGGIGAAVEPHTFCGALLEVIGPQAGHYWSHLDMELAAEAAPDHGFHVFGVYPWTRLLGTGMDEHPLMVLDNCRISWGTVLSAHETTAIVASRALQWDGTALSLGAESTGRVEIGEEAPADRPVTAGDLVAVHWGRVCDRLTPGQARELETATLRQLRCTNRRLAGAPR